MSGFPFLDFAPVPVRVRHDGWSAALQLRFVLGLARGLTPAEAAARLGMSRQSAYDLRRHRGGKSFAAAWEAARSFARQCRLGERPPSPHGIRPDPYRGFVQPPRWPSTPAKGDKVDKGDA
jgi:Homeodomain-like domain-containing protein